MGYVIELDGRRIYHAGDTGLFGDMRLIGEMFRPDVALLPIGAYHPASFRNVHASPADARRWWDSLEYTAARAIRQRTARTNMVIVAGL